MKALLQIANHADAYGATRLLFYLSFGDCRIGYIHIQATAVNMQDCSGDGRCLQVGSRCMQPHRFELRVYVLAIQAGGLSASKHFAHVIRFANVPA